MSAVRTVYITGGTHGNESNGVLLARHLMKHDFSRLKTLDVRVLLTNTASIEANRRYVEEDMNRCFLKADLDDPSKVATLEQRRAKEVNAILGPKGSPAADYIIDLHNTTAATGVALMMSPHDEVSRGLGAHLIASDPSVRLCSWNANQSDWPMLPSVGRHGMTFEVGPVSWGVVDGELYATSLRLILASLDYLEAHNAACAGAGGWEERTVPMFSFVRAVDYPRDEEGQLDGMAHPSLRDFEPLRRGDPAFLRLDETTVVPWNPERPADGAAAAEEEEETMYPFFVNEAAYYEKKTAFVLGRRTDRPARVAVVP